MQVHALAAAQAGVPALHGVDLAVEAGEVVALLGANGAGKSTTLRVLSGLLRATAGEVLLGGRPLLGLPPHRVVAAGVAHVPEGRRVFASLTVEENLRLGAYTDRSGERAALERVLAALPVLDDRRGQRAGTLSGGEQQLLALGRALMSSPRVLLLDEPSTGLAPQAVAAVLDVVAAVAAEGTGVLLVEQDAQVALSLATRGVVLETGRVVASGTAARLREDPRLQEAYLGG